MNAHMSSLIPSTQLYQFAYRSHITTKGLTQSSVMDDIHSVSDVNNKKHGITGVLCYGNGYFFQYIEGSEKALTDLKNNLLVDKRHERIQVLDFSHLEERRFRSWSMRCIILERSDVCEIIKRSKCLHPDQWNDDEWQSFVSKLSEYERKGKPLQTDELKMMYTKKWVIMYRLFKEHQAMFVIQFIVAMLLLLVLIFILLLEQV